VEVQRSPEFAAQREKQRALIEEVRRRYPSAKVSEGEHVERVEGCWRVIPVVIVKFATGQQVTFFSEQPGHPVG
jgi:uncharacterized protein (DUF1330 family)